MGSCRYLKPQHQRNLRVKRKPKIDGWIERMDELRGWTHWMSHGLLHSKAPAIAHFSSTPNKPSVPDRYSIRNRQCSDYYTNHWFSHVSILQVNLKALWNVIVQIWIWQQVGDNWLQIWSAVFQDVVCILNWWPQTGPKRWRCGGASDGWT